MNIEIYAEGIYGYREVYTVDEGIRFIAQEMCEHGYMIGIYLDQMAQFASAQDYTDMVSYKDWLIDMFYDDIMQGVENYNYRFTFSIGGDSIPVTYDNLLEYGLLEQAGLEKLY
jgi:hypothetical protein